MNEAALERAARAAYDASCAVHGQEPDDRTYKVQVMEWQAVARAAVEAAADPEWPLRARVWTRTSVEPHEKVLEIEGVIDDVHMTCRHTQPMSVADADVPGLPDLYEDDAIPATASRYARNVLERGDDVVRRELERLAHKMRTASSLYRDGPVKAELHLPDGHEERLLRMLRRRDQAGIAEALDRMQAQIVAAQRMANPAGKASVVLHLDEEHWDRWNSMQDKTDSDEEFLRRATADR